MFEETRIINDKNETHQLARDLIEKAQSEVLVFFSSMNSFKRQLEVKNDQLVLEAARRGVVVIIVAPMDESTKKGAENLEKQNEKLAIRSIKPLIDRPFNTIVVDKKYSLVIGINDDSKLTVEEAIGQAIYSTNKRAVEDSIFRFNIIFRDFEDESESIKRWLADAVKIADECRHEMN